MTEKQYIVTHKKSSIDTREVAELLGREFRNFQAVDMPSRSAQGIIHYEDVGVTILSMMENEAERFAKNPNLSVIEDFQIEGFSDTYGKYMNESSALLTKAFSAAPARQKIPKNIKTVGADQVWNYATGKGVKVAVLDTGIYLGHPDLVVTGGVRIEKGSVVKGGGWYDDADTSHGTHSAGIIGARNNDLGIVGVAPECDLYAVKILDKDQKGHFSSLLAALHWALKEKMDVLSISCRWADNELGQNKNLDCLDRCVQKLNQNGCVIVSASGNIDDDHTENMVCEPALQPGVIAVGTIDVNNSGQYAYHSTSKMRLWPKSCWKPGGTVDLCAPGVNVCSTVNLNNLGGYAHKEGTSMACPHVAGAAALLKELQPGWTSEQIRSTLCETAWDIEDVGIDDKTGSGLLDCYAAVQKAMKP